MQNQSAKYFLSSVFILFTFNLFGQSPTESIKINQIGFYPKAPKIAVITGQSNSKEFYITSTNQRDTLFRGQLEHERKSLYSSTTCRIADFSTLTVPGSYVLVVPQVGHSYNFTIDNDVHRRIVMSTLKGYYYQRCSISLDVQFAGKWHRSAGHPDNKVFIHPSAASDQRPAGTIISTPGGWYDAGDYNKYIVNSGISTGTLLSAYEDFPDYFRSLKTNIPETDDGVPDILNECIYNLRWMLTMQDPNDGGVYNKCTNAKFDGMVMPGVTTLPRYVVQKGTAATLDLVSVAAQASRILRNYNKQFPGLADSCLAASINGWNWSKQHSDVLYDQDAMNKKLTPQITTGAYGDNNLQDEWFWAACELLVTTKKADYFETVSQKYVTTYSVPAWNNVAMPGIYSLIRNEKNLPGIAGAMVLEMKKSLLMFSDSLITGSSKSAFNTVIGQSVKDFIWGSNAVASNQSNVLINAFKITGDKKYLNYALSNLDYILGRNATGYCFVTGAGSKSTMHPHHRQSVSDGVTEPVPGLLAGGPNPGRQDGSVYEFVEPETAYTDKSEAYACNEIAINWNAPLVYLVSAIEALQKYL